MATIKWSLKDATATDNFKIGTNEDGTPILEDGVITEVNLELVVSEGEVSKSIIRNIRLENPDLDNFIPLYSLEESQVYTWAISSMSEANKNHLESLLTDIVTGKAPTTRKVFTK